MKKKILIINGPNLNLLGIREKSIYGTASFSELEQLCQDAANRLGVTIDCRQTNHEGDIVHWIQEAYGKYHGIVINPAAYTHTSVAIRDALLVVAVPVVEVHISNIFARESFRHHSFITPVAQGMICGFGIQGYSLAIEALVPSL